MRTIALGVIVGMLLAAGCGDPDADGEREIAPGEPVGEVARLRLEVVEPQISCDGGTHTLQVWLDDLPRVAVVPPDDPRNILPPETPYPTPVPPEGAGAIGFQFELHYDPAVVWVAEKSDVRIADGLNEAPPASDVERNFAPAAFLDNHDGYAFVGGLALGLGATAQVTPVSRPTPLPQPAGVDPVAAGEPILLMEIGMTAVGPGETELTVGDEQLQIISFSGHRYAPVETAGATLGVTGDCPAVETPTPRPSDSPTPLPPTVAPQPSIVPVTPGVGTREDCPDDWAVADAPSFSFCFPSDFVASQAAYEDGVAFHVGRGPSTNANSYYVSIAESDHRQFALGADCSIVTVVPSVREGSVRTVELDDASVELCFAAGTNTLAVPHVEMEAFVGDVPTESGFVSIGASYSGTDLQGGRLLIEQILRSLVVK